MHELSPIHPHRISQSAKLMINRRSIRPFSFYYAYKLINLNMHITVMRQATGGKDSTVVTSVFRMQLLALLTFRFT